MQTKLASFRESIDNILIGYIVAVISQVLIFPMFGIEVAFTENMAIAGYFTIISVIRSYLVRRWKNKKAICPQCGFTNSSISIVETQK